MPDRAQTTRNVHRTEANYGAVNARIDGLQQNLADFRQSTTSAIESISTKIDRIATPRPPNTQVWISAAALLISVTASIFVLGVSPIKESIAKNEADTKAAVAKVELESRLGRKDLAEEVKGVRTEIVPRGEHAEKWRSYETQLATLNARIDETRRTLGELYSPKDAFKDLQKQIDDLRSAVLRSKTEASLK